MTNPKDETKIMRLAAPREHLPCLVCGTDMVVDGESGSCSYPCIDGDAQGTLGRIRGGWNSAVYDPMVDLDFGYDQFLQFAICDECLRKHADRLRVFKYRIGDVVAKEGTWEPNEK